ncbi:hypothetical protein AB833_04295 [Chromatiales bacterium (ex Bugula neritina AB1)]|nr:hypothetical protein AB833_04295 [Chromatiales bacterium (ex Bugula neritina AB1)]
MDIPDSLMSVQQTLSVYQTLTTPIWVFDFDNMSVIWANEGALDLWQASSCEELASRNMSKGTSATVATHLLNIRQHLLKGSKFSDRWTLYPRGVPRHCFLEYRNIKLDDGRDGMLIECVGQDLHSDSETLRSTEALRHTSLMISLYSEDFSLLYCNPAAHSMLPKALTHLSDHIADPQDWDNIKTEITLSDQFLVEASVFTKAGRKRHKMHFQHSQDAVTGKKSILVSESDITLLHKGARDAHHQARTDSLTGFANRLYLKEKLAAIASNPQATAGIIYIDLDRFKNINDSLGHSVGDKLLIAVAHTINQCVSKDMTLVRLGGDEFLLLLESVNHYETLTKISQCIINRLDSPLSIDSSPLRVTPSIGICLYPSDADSPESLLQHADIAMYQSKAAGGNQYHIFTDQMLTEVKQRSQLEQQLALAIKQNQFVLHYQPRYAADGKTIAGAEALIRWQHPERGLLYPGSFIYMAEETRLINQLGDWVLREGARQAAQWHRQGMGIRVSVNLSARQFSSGNFVDNVQMILQDTGCPAHLLELELTESMLINDIPNVAKVLKRLHKLGVRTAIDDFGTGYSNLVYLQSFDIHCLKIDKAFVQSMDKPAILNMILSLGELLGMTIVAEGIETKEQLSWLQDNGCHELQGFYLAKPMTSEQLGKILVQSKLTRYPDPAIHHSGGITETEMI